MIVLTGCRVNNCKRYQSESLLTAIIVSLPSLLIKTRKPHTHLLSAWQLVLNSNQCNNTFVFLPGKSETVREYRPIRVTKTNSHKRDIEWLFAEKNIKKSLESLRFYPWAQAKNNSFNKLNCLFLINKRTFVAEYPRIQNTQSYKFTQFVLSMFIWRSVFRCCGNKASLLFDCAQTRFTPVAGCPLLCPRGVTTI